MAEITQILGNYMLRGWILTDRVCMTPGCNTPLMRAPPHLPPESFCARCNGGPVGNSTATVQGPIDLASNEEADYFETGSDGDDDDDDDDEEEYIYHPPMPAELGPQSSASSPSSASQVPSAVASGASHSTGITEPASDVHDEFVLPPPSEETLRRQAQSDYASREIGSKLLQGWAMLGDECPNSTCYGVPLMRPPKHFAEDAMRQKLCVVCKRVYMVSSDGRMQVLEAPSNETVATHSETQNFLLSTQAGPSASRAVSTSSTNRTIELDRDVRTGLPVPREAESTSSAVIHAPSLTASRRVALYAPSPAIAAAHRTLETSLSAITERMDDATERMDVAQLTEMSTAMSSVFSALTQYRVLSGELPHS